MNDQLTALERDIGFLKSLAEEGRPATVIGGSILVAAGLTFGIASLAEWAVWTHRAPNFGPWTSLALWGASFVIFMVELAVILRRLAPHKSAGRANRTLSAAWTGAGYTIFALVACALIAAWRTGSDAPAMLIPAMILCVYGLCWTVAASAAGKSWVWAAAVGSYASAALVAVFCAGPAVYLIYALALVAVAILPGLALIRQSRPAQ
jgi:hypothetical protein